MKTAEERGREFLEFIAGNREKLRRNLAKNVTFDAEIFEDVFSDTIVRVYDSIVDKGQEIKDYEQYFFMASRNNYIKRSERRRRLVSRLKGIHVAADHPDEDSATPLPELEEVKRNISDLFGQRESEIFFGYMAKKNEGRTNYKEYANELGIPTWHVTQICSKISRYLKN